MRPLKVRRRGNKSLLIRWSPVGGLSKHKGEELEITISKVCASHAHLRGKQNQNKGCGEPGRFGHATQNFRK
jgi:hypothetical protein